MCRMCGHQGRQREKTWSERERTEVEVLGEKNVEAGIEVGMARTGQYTRWSSASAPQSSQPRASSAHAERPAACMTDVIINRYV